MLVVGLTGSLSTGKSTVAALLKQKGARVLDADRMAHDVMTRRPCLRKIVSVFGTEVLHKGKVDRRKIAAVVFNDQRKLNRLVKIIHPFVIKEMTKKVKACQRMKISSVVVLDVPLLFESGLHRLADVTVVVSAPQKQQIQRAMRRLKISKTEALARIKSQMPLHKKIQQADIIVDNSQNLNKTKKQVNDIWQKLWQKTKN